MCPYAYYKKVKDYDRELIYCNKTEEVCSHIRYCNELNKIVPSESMGECIMVKKKRLMPKNACAVRKTVSNEKFLYVDIEKDGNLYTHKLKNIFETIPDYVYVEEGIDGNYEIIDKKKK